MKEIKRNENAEILWYILRDQGQDTRAVITIMIDEGLQGARYGKHMEQVNMQ